MVPLKSSNTSTDIKRKPTAGSARNAARPERKKRGGRPAKQAAEALEHRILDVASELFCAQGFSATTMEQVARKCRAGKDTIYRRYPSKKDLFQALIIRARQEVLRDLKQIAAAPGEPLEILRNFARALLAVNLRPDLAALHRVTWSEAIPNGGLVTTKINEDPIMALLASLYLAAQNANALKEGDPLERAEQLLYATSIKPMLNAMRGSQEYVDPALQDTYFNMAWGLFLEGAQG